MPVEHLDVLIVGAGLSGVGAAYHLMKHCPGKSFALLEGRAAMGGTWDLFRYPGIRSDSDMFTLGYNFKPWSDPKAIADGPSIRRYIEETARENGIDRKIRYRHRVLRADWDSANARWNLDVQRGDEPEPLRMTAQFLLMCTGYYRYEAGYTPEFVGREDFAGQVVHPQLWPEDLDYSGKKVVVIGSGATAVTLVPSLTDKAAHVTMLQRSPSYVITLPQKDAISNFLRRFLPETWIYRQARARNVAMQMVFFMLARTFPGLVRKALLRGGPKSNEPQLWTLGFPTYSPIASLPDVFRTARSRVPTSSSAPSQLRRFQVPSPVRRSGWRRRSGSVWTSWRATALGQTWPRLNGSSLSPRIALISSPRTSMARPQIASHRLQAR